MSNLRNDYEKKRARYESVRDKVCKAPAAAPVGFTQESEYQSAFRAMNVARKALINAGEWDGPIPITPKGHK